jgi:hypothetical protein
MSAQFASALDPFGREAYEQALGIPSGSMLDALPYAVWSEAEQLNALAGQTTPAEFASFEKAGIQAELRKPEYLALINDFRSRMAEEGPQPTAANIELVRGIDGEIGRDFAKLFGEEGYGELGGFPIGPVLGVPLREKLQAASDANLSGEVPRLFAGINTDAPFEDQVTAAFNVIGGRATDEQFLHVMNAISEGRNTSSSAFVVDITAARLTSEVGALEARGYGYDFFNRVSQAEDFNREAWLAPGGGATLFGSLAKIAQGFSSDVSLVSDNLAPVDMQKAARNSLILDAFSIAAPVAAAKLFNIGKAFVSGPTRNISRHSAATPAHNAANFAKHKELLSVTESANPLVNSLKNTGQLPSNYVTKAQAVKQGWKPGKALGNSIPGGQLGGDVFQNTTNVLPSVQGGRCQDTCRLS